MENPQHPKHISATQIKSLAPPEAPQCPTLPTCLSFHRGGERGGAPRGRRQAGGCEPAPTSPGEGGGGGVEMRFFVFFKKKKKGKDFPLKPGFSSSYGFPFPPSPHPKSKEI